MMSMQDMFYSNAEPVWVVKSSSDKKKDGDKKDGQEEEKKEFSILNVIPNYPYYYPPYVPEPAPAKADAKKETKVALRVSICCNECVESITVALKELPGVKDVDCNIRKEKVVVTCATTTPVGDVISTSRRAFKDARPWTDDDE